MKFDFDSYMERYVSKEEKDKYHDRIINIKERFTTGDLAYWSDVNSYIDNQELERLLTVSRYIASKADVLIVIGIGGSYMGAKAIIEALTPIYEKTKPEMLYLGTDLNANEYDELFKYIDDKSVFVNVISKSGTTLEPSVAFSLIKKRMELKYSDEEIKKRIIVTTDSKKGILREEVSNIGYTSFVVPDNIGGRFSVLTPVGLLPIAVSGIDVTKLLKGSVEGQKELNQALEYAVVRDILYNKGKSVESYTIYNSKLYYFTEWLKQLFAETEGKNGKGLLPISMINTRDLHSLGQYFQEGKDIIFETVIGIEKDKYIYIDELNKDMNEVNRLALYQVAQAHYNGYTPSNIILIDELNEENLGKLIQLFIYSSITGALLLDVNPFDQPGVQEYKKLINEALK